MATNKKVHRPPYYERQKKWEANTMKLPKKFTNSNTFPSASTFLKPGAAKKTLTLALSVGLIFATLPQNLSAFQDAQNSQDAQNAPPDQSAQGTAAPAYTAQTPAQLQQLVAPIALYPDSLVAQILAGATFPAQIVEADRWVQNNSTLKGDALAQAVDQQNWDPSIKALTAFPSVLGNMDKNLSWTSSLGDAYYNQQQDVMDAIQVMRQKAENAGNLKTTDQQTVQTQGSSIVIQPADPQVVYVPAYDPWVIYGGPIAPWPYWYNYPGIWFGGPFLSFGVGFGIGFYGGFGWGWNHWGTNWGGRSVVFNHNDYRSRSNTFYNRNNYYRNGGARGVANNVNRGFNADRGGHPFDGNKQAARGFGQPHTQSNVHSGAFSGYDHGGDIRADSSRGSQSFGGSRGGGFGGGHGGGFGGGGHGGGGHGR
jgi:uncharacterized membrane protein YgcG